MFHVARRELERKFEIFFAETARMGIKSSANESGYLPRHSAPVFIATRAEPKDCSIWPGIGSTTKKFLETITHALTQQARLALKVES
jgi:hypothetical protein